MFSHLPKKRFLKASTSAQEIPNNYDRLHDLLEYHKSCYTFQRLFHRTWLQPTFTSPLPLRQDTEGLHCNRLSSNICRMTMYRISVREYCGFFKKKINKCMSKTHLVDWKHEPI